MDTSLPSPATDVVIVGAGISGLVAARELVAVGLDVVVLESRDRVGGRLLSHRSDDGAAFDLGATWFWPNEPRVRELISELGIAVHEQHLEGNAIYHDPNGSQRIDGNPLDVPSGRFSTGAQSLATALADRLPDGCVLTDRAATAVHATAGGITVETAGGPVRGEHVILALPPALAVERIAFSPHLAGPLGDLAASTPVWMGAIVKVVMRFTTAFWRDQGLAGAAISHFGPMREIHDMSGPDGTPAALFGFVPLMTPEASAPTEAQVRAQLTELFGPDAPGPSEVVMMDWRAESDTSPRGVVGLRTYELFGHPLYQEPAMAGRLHWASTETATTFAGHIEGAIEAGSRAAHAIIRVLPRSTGIPR